MLRCLEQSVYTTVACRQESGPDQRVTTHAHMGVRVGIPTCFVVNIMLTII